MELTSLITDAGFNSAAVLRSACLNLYNFLTQRKKQCLICDVSLQRLPSLQFILLFYNNVYFSNFESFQVICRRPSQTTFDLELN